MELDHTYQGVSVYASGKTWNKLSAEQQGWLTQSVDEIGSQIGR